MKIVFMGTPEIAAQSLEKLAEKHEITAVFTQPDKPKNRGKQIEVSEVKAAAEKLGIPVFQPNSLRRGEDARQALDALHKAEPDVITVVAYGQILPKEVLETPRLGCVNLHASLLPRWRGAAPIQRCIEAGDEKSGVCIMKMDEGLDTGDVILRGEVEITPETTGTSLTKQLSALGAELLLEALGQLENGSAVFEKQTGDAVYAEKILKSELKIDFTKPAAAVVNFIHAMADAPCAYMMLGEKRLKVYRARESFHSSDRPAGEIVNDKKFEIVCGGGKCIELLEVQLEGSKRMKTEEFLRGRKL